MKLNKISALLLGAMVIASCSDIDDQNPESGKITGGQVQETTDALSSRLDATLNGMYTMGGSPLTVFGTASGRADDFGFISAALSQDLEGADMFSGNNYNWFSAACEYSTRNPDYANPYARYTLPYRQIGVAEQVINSINVETADAKGKAQAGQAYAARAYDYMALAPYFQFGYATSKDQPCVPIIGKNDANNNPRATVAEVYDVIVADLTKAIELLDGYSRTDKTQIDQHVAYGLRARAYLAMGEYSKAAEDADKAMQGYTPASIADVSVPTFDNINESNWIWGFGMTNAMVNGDDNQSYANPSSWFGSFSGDGYAPATGNVPCINVLLYDKIPSTDVRKGWWLNAEKHSPNWANLTWAGATGDAIADLTTDDGGKVPFDAYTSIKFGQKSGVGSTLNNNDFPLMRVEEMILIKVEGLAKSGHEAEAKNVLENFVKTYRDPSYSVTAGGRTLADEIWFQRRVELWGEGFFVSDAKRLGKPIVRFHAGQTSNYPAAFKFNLAANDGWLNMRFPTREKNNNAGIIDNQDGSQPTPNQNGELRDGVTD